MEFPVRTGSAAGEKTGCLILPVFQSGQLSGPAGEVDASCGGALSRLVTAGDASAKPGRTLLAPGS